MNPIDTVGAATTKVNTLEKPKARARALIALLYLRKQASWKTDFALNGICINYSQLQLLEYNKYFTVCVQPYVHIQIAKGGPDRRSI